MVEYGTWLLRSQVILYPAFGLCYMMTITFQTVGASKMGLFLSVIRQGLFYVPFILTLLVCILLVWPMKRIASRNMAAPPDRQA